MNDTLNELVNNEKFKECYSYSYQYGLCDKCSSCKRISSTYNMKKIFYKIDLNINDICLGCLLKSYSF